MLKDLKRLTFAAALSAVLAPSAFAAAIPEIDFSTRPNYIPNNVVVLTFDDAPDYDHTAEVVNALKAKNAKATFFLNGENWSSLSADESMRALVRRIANEGHTVASHTVHHPHLSEINNNDVEFEVTGMQNLVNGVFGNNSHELTLFRAPYGDPYQGNDPSNPKESYSRIAPIVAKHAVHIGWSIDSGDFDCNDGDGDCVYNNVTRALGTPGNGDYGIILMHSVYKQTALAVPRIIDYIRANGFQIWSVEDVVRARYGKSSYDIIHGGNTGGGTTNPPVVTGDTYSVVSRFSNKCLDITEPAGVDGAKLQQWECHGGQNQKFRLQPVSGGIYNLVSLASGKCLDVEGPSVANGAKLQQWACSGGTNQQVRLKDAADGSKILSMVNSNKCLDIDGPSANNGARVHQWDCHAGTSQTWFLRK
jgi:peptidoglycan/xylan/chitin deacetylase (PgdA/CDA1 family)